jgi:hypothetical protein
MGALAQRPAPASSSSAAPPCQVQGPEHRHRGLTGSRCAEHHVMSRRVWVRKRDRTATPDCDQELPQPAAATSVALRTRRPPLRRARPAARAGRGITAGAQLALRASEPSDTGARWRGSGREAVLTYDAAQPVPASHVGACQCRDRGTERGWCGIWGAEAKRAVRTMSVVVVDEHAPHELEVWAP